MKKLISLFLVVALLLAPICFATVQTDYDEYAQRLSLIGVFKGTSNGFELERAPTRLEGMVMLIRLLGKEDEAKNEYILDKNSYFIDVPEWGIPYTNYAFKNGLSSGIGNNRFGSDQKLVANAYYTFVLRALGYDDQKGDFTYNGALEFALKKGVIEQSLYSQLKGNAFIRDHVAKASYDGLYSLTNGSNTRLIDALVSSGDIDPETAKRVEIKNSSVIIIDLNKYDEFVKIQNIGSVEVDISGWTLISEKGNQTFVFPAGYVLKAGQVCTLTSGDLKGTGDFTMATTTIWNNSESDPAVLINTAGEEVFRWND